MLYYQRIDNEWVRYPTEGLADEQWAVILHWFVTRDVLLINVDFSDIFEAVGDGIYRHFIEASRTHEEWLQTSDMQYAKMQVKELWD